VYGADAVAGVVNFILKNNFEGVELNTSYGFSGEDDAVRRKFDLTVGGNFAEDRGNAVVSFGYTKTDPLYQDPVARGAPSRARRRPATRWVQAPRCRVVSAWPA